MTEQKREIRIIRSDCHDVHRDTGAICVNDVVNH